MELDVPGNNSDGDQLTPEFKQMRERQIQEFLSSFPSAKRVGEEPLAFEFPIKLPLGILFMKLFVPAMFPQCAPSFQVMATVKHQLLDAKMRVVHPDLENWMPMRHTISLVFSDIFNQFSQNPPQPIKKSTENLGDLNSQFQKMLKVNVEARLCAESMDTLEKFQRNDQEIKKWIWDEHEMKQTNEMIESAGDKNVDMAMANIQLKDDYDEAVDLYKNSCDDYSESSKRYEEKLSKYREICHKFDKEKLLGGIQQSIADLTRKRSEIRTSAIHTESLDVDQTLSEFINNQKMYHFCKMKRQRVEESFSDLY